MALASDLFFNDADWLDTSSIRLAHPAVPHAVAETLGVRSLRSVIRQTLDVRSLRPVIMQVFHLSTHSSSFTPPLSPLPPSPPSHPSPHPRYQKDKLESSSSYGGFKTTLFCPTPDMIQDALRVDSRPCLRMLWDVLNLADHLGCSRFHIYLDWRHHPNMSLLHPGLSR